MKIDNSRNLEEKYQEGYNAKISEIRKGILIVVESDLYEVTIDQLNIFLSKRGPTIEEKHNSLDYLHDYCNCINDSVRVYNY